MALCTFFGLKNTPLGLAVKASHAQLNILHRIVGYTAVLLITLHAILYTIRLARQDNLAKLLETSDLAGIGAGLSMIVLLLGYFRHRGYEIFYLSHIGGFFGVLFLAYIHRPNWAKKLPYVLMFAGSIWAADRIIRAARMARNSINNSATLQPLPDGGTRIILKKSCGALPGSHCYLWIPRLHLYENHPFTIGDSGPSGLELVMKAQDGFTRVASNFAIQHPKKPVWGSIDGPYGSLPDAEEYDKLVLVAGGSGAAFTFGLMNRILRQHQQYPAIDFVWAVRHRGMYAKGALIVASVLTRGEEHLTWFQEHLERLADAEPRVNVILYITGDDLETNTKLSDRTSEHGPSTETILLSKGGSPNYETISRVDDDQPLLDSDADTDVDQLGDLRFTKMDTRDVLSESLQDVVLSQRVLVASCGPKSLMDSIREVTDEYLRLGYRIDAHSEDFGGS